MQDFIKKYKKSKLIWNIWIVVTSLIVALWVNFFIIDWTDVWQSLKASIFNVNGIEINSDIYFDIEDNNIVLKTNKIINDVKDLSLSIIYNPKNVEIEKLDFSKSNITELENEKWIKSIIITFENPKNITPDEIILKIKTIKKEDKSENLNIINANFTDTLNNNYILTTSWITF